MPKRSKIIVSFLFIVFFVLSPVVIVATWDNLGEGSGLQFRREREYFARRHLVRGEVFEAVNMYYHGIQVAIRTEVKWFFLQNDVESFDNLRQQGQYQEAHIVCNEVGLIFEHGPPGWDTFLEDCTAVHALLLSTRGDDSAP